MMDKMTMPEDAPVVPPVTGYAMAMMDIGIATHTFWLNLTFIPIAIALLWVRHRTLKQQEQKETRGAEAARSGS